MPMEDIGEDIDNLMNTFITDRLAPSPEGSSCSNTLLATSSRQGQKTSKASLFSPIEPLAGVVGTPLQENVISSSPSESSYLYPLSESSSPFEGSYSLGDRRISEEPSPSVRATQMLGGLEDSNRIAKQQVENFSRMLSATRTMTMLRALNFLNLGPSMANLCTINQGFDFSKAELVLNNNPSMLFDLSVPSENSGEPTIFVIPSIVPAGAHLYVKGKEENVPSKHPTAEDNRVVRCFIREAFEVFYGDENAKVWLPDFYEQQNDARPVTAMDVSNALYLADEHNSKKNEDGNEFKENVLPEAMPAASSDVAKALLNEHSIVHFMDAAARQNMEQLAYNAHQELENPDKYLKEAAGHVGSAAVSVGHVLVTTVGTAAAGGILGGAITSCIASMILHRDGRDGTANMIGGAGAEYLTPGVLSVTGYAGTHGLTLALHHALAGSFLGLVLGGGLIVQDAVNSRDYTNLGHRLLVSAVAGGAVSLLGFPIVSSIGMITYGGFNAYYEWEKLNLGSSFRHVVEALNRWNGVEEGRALVALKDAQAIDQESIKVLNSLFKDFVSVTESSDTVSSSSSSSIVATVNEEAKADAGIREGEVVLNNAQLEAFFIGQIKQRMQDRAALIDLIQAKYDELEARRGAAKKTFHTSEFRARYPRGF